MGKVNHPNIVRVYELLQDNKFYYIVSEFVEHGELFDYIIEKDPVCEADVKNIIK